MSLSLLAQDATLFRSGVSLVRVDIQVVDAGGEILTGLAQDDFRVFDQGSPQTPAAFAFEKDALDLVLLFDTGGGMKSKLHQTLRAVELGFHELQQGDRVCLMTFSGAPVEIAPFSPDLETVDRDIVLKILNGGFGGRSNPASAASAAAQRLAKEPSNRRRAVLLIGASLESKAPSRTAVADLWRANAVLGQLIPQNPGRNAILPRGQNPLADETGGETILAGDPGAAFQESVRDLRKRYTIYYPAPQAESGSVRRIEVTLSPAAAQRYPGARLWARGGYIAGP